MKQLEQVSKRIREIEASVLGVADADLALLKRPEVEAVLDGR